MFDRIVIFIKYHNALPLGLMLVFLSVTGALAANDEVRDAAIGTVVAKETVVKSVDNSFIVNTNLDQFAPSAQITDVNEDEENYYVVYSLNTIDIEGGIWGVVSRPKEITVSKAFLVKRDLGLYLAKEIKEVVDKQSEFLKEVQNIERKNGATQKVVATTYSGLIGKFLDPKEEVIVGYEPVIKPDLSPLPYNERADVTTEQEPPQAAEQGEQFSQPAAVLTSSAQNQQPQNDTSVSGGTSASTGSGATMVMIGNNPARVPTSSVGGGYSDNGVRAQNSSLQDLSVSVTVNNVAMTDVSIDTRKPGAHTVRYIAQDENENTMALERQVIVYDRYKTKEPAIVILGETAVSLHVGETYNDAGAIAIDYDDGDVTKKITVENTVNTSVEGAYKVRYTAVDLDGNIANAVRIVTVTNDATSTQPMPADN